MKKLTAIVTALVLGSTTVAVAAPFLSRPERQQEQARRYRHSWVALSEPFALDRVWRPIDVAERGTFTQLRLQTARGASQIHRVVIHFKNGEQQIVDVHKRLAVDSPMLEITLDGNNRKIDRIVIVGDSHRNAAVQVFAI